jgi:hypothetical protein
MTDTLPVRCLFLGIVLSNIREDIVDNFRVKMRVYMPTRTYNYIDNHINMMPLQCIIDTYNPVIFEDDHDSRHWEITNTGGATADLNPRYSFIDVYVRPVSDVAKTYCGLLR